MDWRLLGLFIISCWSCVMNVILFIVGKHVATKITQNDLVHLAKDVATIKSEDKDFKKEIKEEIHDIHLGIRRIERSQIQRDAICNERHSGDTKK